MRIVFFGSDDFAAIVLNQIYQSGIDVAACVTQPDARQGRGMKISLSPIKEIALEHDTPCLQPITLKEVSVVDHLKQFNADLFVVVAYGRLLPQAVLDIPKLFCLNVHGSLLPKYRGAAPVNWAILNGDKETGVTVQKMVLELDAGDIIAQEKLIIAPDETSAQLRLRMAQVGAKLLVKTIDEIQEGKYKLIPQDKTKISQASKLSKEMGKIDWNVPAEQIYNKIRGLQPWPGAYTQYKGKTLKILDASMVETKALPGEVVKLGKNGIVIACKNGGLLIKQVHPEASKAMSAYNFLLGYRLTLGERLI